MDGGCQLIYLHLVALFFFLCVVLSVRRVSCEHKYHTTSVFLVDFCTRHQNGQYQGKGKKRDNNEKLKKNNREYALRTSQKQACNFRNGKQVGVHCICLLCFKPRHLLPEYIQLWFVLFQQMKRKKKPNRWKKNHSGIFFLLRSISFIDCNYMTTIEYKQRLLSCIRFLVISLVERYAAVGNTPRSSVCCLLFC